MNRLAAARLAETSVASHGTTVRRHAQQTTRHIERVAEHATRDAAWLAGHWLRGASFGCERFMTPGLPSLGHVLSTEVPLGGEGVVSATMQRKVCGGVRTLPAERLSMVELEPACFSTALTSFVDKRAARTIALVDCPTYGRGNVTAAPASICVRRGCDFVSI